MVKKDMGTHVEPYGLVSAVAMKQRNAGAKPHETGNGRIDFLARQLDLVTAELNESIGRVPQKRLLQIVGKLNVLRAQMNEAISEEDRPRRKEIFEKYSPRNVAKSADYKTRKLYASSYDELDDAEAVEQEMQNLIDQTYGKPLQRSSSADNLQHSNYRYFLFTKIL